jgi:phage terminase large subunit-like protein
LESGGAAAVALTEGTLEPGTDVVIAAADADQARIVLENIDGYTTRNEALGGLWRSRGDERLTEAGSRIRVIASDAPTAMGLGGTRRRFRTICDELTAWRADGELWVALASATGKVADVQTIVLSNAGFSPESSWQWGVRQTAKDADWGHLFSPDGVVASWITAEWVEEMRTLLPSAAFDRLVSNIWTSGTGDFCTEKQWQRCVDERLAPRTRGLGTRHYAGLDLGLTRDRTAFAIVHRDDGDITLAALFAADGRDRVDDAAHARTPARIRNPWARRATPLGRATPGGRVPNRVPVTVE